MRPTPKAIPFFDTTVLIQGYGYAYRTFPDLDVASPLAYSSPKEMQAKAGQKNTHRPNNLPPGFAPLPITEKERKRSLKRWQVRGVMDQTEVWSLEVTAANPQEACRIACTRIGGVWYLSQFEFTPTISGPNRYKSDKGLICTVTYKEVARVH